LILGEEAREQLNLARVLFVPAGQPWRKSGRPIASAEHRLAMLQLALGDNSAFEVSNVELERPGPSYTAETLSVLKETNGGVDLFFILGQDALSDLPSWHDPGRIVQLATLAVAGREGAPEDVPDDLGARVVRLSMPVIEISGSEIRARVAEGRSIRYRVPLAVERYIRDNGLYRD
jgi:nicotinate-nucleotide adenylyltransferase